MHNPMQGRHASDVRCVRSSWGFTIVEFFVVFAIISILIGLLFSAIVASREASRRNRCGQMEQDIGVALLNFATSHQFFPGYVNSLPGGSVLQNGAGQYAQPVSWVITLLPYLEQKDLYDNWERAVENDWQTSNAMSNANNVLSLSDTNFGSIVTMNFLQCPSDPRQIDGPGLSYVVNRGRNGWNNNPAVGVCFDQYSPAAPVGVGPAYISSHDGTSTTLLLSESVQTPLPNLPSTTLPESPPTYYQQLCQTRYAWVDATHSTEQIYAFNPSPSKNEVAYDIPKTRPYMGLLRADSVMPPSTTYPVPVIPTATPPVEPNLRYYYRPNSNWTSTIPPDTWTSGANPTVANLDTTELDLAFEWSALATFNGDATFQNLESRPEAHVTDVISSRHDGIINVLFCDGHVYPLATKTNVDVFRQLMTPYGNGYLNLFETPPGDAPVGPLDQSSF